MEVCIDSMACYLSRLPCVILQIQNSPSSLRTNCLITLHVMDYMLCHTVFPKGSKFYSTLVFILRVTDRFFVILWHCVNYRTLWTLYRIIINHVQPWLRFIKYFISSYLAEWDDNVSRPVLAASARSQYSDGLITEAGHTGSHRELQCP